MIIATYVKVVKDVLWKRPSEWMEDGATPVLFAADPTPSTIVQGAIGDCYFIAAVSLLAGQQAGSTIRSLFVDTETSAQGVYTCRFFHNGAWKVVIVDGKSNIASE